MILPVWQYHHLHFKNMHKFSDDMDPNSGPAHGFKRVESLVELHWQPEWALTPVDRPTAVVTTIIQEMHRDRSAARKNSKKLKSSPSRYHILLTSCFRQSFLAGNFESLCPLGLTLVDRPTIVVTSIIQEMHRDRSTARTSHKTCMGLNPGRGQNVTSLGQINAWLTF